MEILDQPQRRHVLEKVLETVSKKFVAPTSSAPDIKKLRDEHQAQIVGSVTAEEFDHASNCVLQWRGTSHTGCFHQSRPRAAGRIAIAATFTKADTADGLRWVFQDVHPGGVAARAGIRPGDVLLTVEDKELLPPESTGFMLGHSYGLSIRRADGSTIRSTLEIPSSREKQRPIVVPDQVVTSSKLDHDHGFIRVSMFPGVLGMDVARDISRAVAELACSRLIFDLRGNTGGGIGCLRMMSHLCPASRGVGYSVGAALMRRGYQK